MKGMGLFSANGVIALIFYFMVVLFKERKFSKTIKGNVKIAFESNWTEVKNSNGAIERNE